MEKKINLKSSLEILQNKQNLEHVIDKILILKKEIEMEGSLYGITNKVIAKVMGGEEVIQCRKCGSPNAYRTHFDLTQNSKNYKCNSCKSYLTIKD